MMFTRAKTVYFTKHSVQNNNNSSVYIAKARDRERTRGPAVKKVIHGHPQLLRCMYEFTASRQYKSIAITFR